MGPDVKRATCSGASAELTERRRASFARAIERGRSEALIAWMSRFFERGEGVKGGFAAA